MFFSISRKQVEYIRDFLYLGSIQAGFKESKRMMTVWLLCGSMLLLLLNNEACIYVLERRRRAAMRAPRERA